MRVQVILVSQGMVMYEGPTIEMIPWFTQSLEYQYNPEVNGVPSDWVLDLVSVGFSKPKVSPAFESNTHHSATQDARSIADLRTRDVQERMQPAVVIQTHCMIVPPSA